MCRLGVKAAQLQPRIAKCFAKHTIAPRVIGKGTECKNLASCYHQFILSEPSGESLESLVALHRQLCATATMLVLNGRNGPKMSIPVHSPEGSKHAFIECYRKS